MKKLLRKSSTPNNSYPLSTISLTGEDINSKPLLDSDSATTTEEFINLPPETPDSLTPLRGRASLVERSSQYNRTNRSMSLKSNINVSSTEEPKDFSFNEHFHLKSNQQPAKIPAFLKSTLFLVQYYIKYLWFLLRSASARTVTFPIAFSTTTSLEKGLQTAPILIGNTFNLFSPQNPIRKGLAALFRSQITEVFLTLLIILHWFVLLTWSWETEERVPEHKRSEGIEVNGIDRTIHRKFLQVIFIIYTIEAVFRAIVGGLFKDGIQFPKVKHVGEVHFGQKTNINDRIYSTRSAYLRRSFNRLDLITIICFWAYHIAYITWKEDYHLLLALSSLRIFRLLNFASGSQVILKSLKASAPLLANVLYLILFFLLAYSILGTTFFRTSLKGRCFIYNDDGTIGEKTAFDRFCGSYQLDNVINQPQNADGSGYYPSNRLTNGYTCPSGQICKEDENPNDGLTSYDNVGFSFIYVFIMGSGQSWSDTLYNVVDGSTKFSSLYYVIVILTLNFWLINMFVAVIAEVFANLRSKQSSAFANSQSSLNLFEEALIADDSPGVPKLDRGSPPPVKKQRFGAFYKTLLPIKDIVNRSLLYNCFWLVLVVANLFVLGLRTSTSTDQELRVYSGIEFGLSVLLALEIIIRYLFWDSDRSFSSHQKNKLDLVLCLINTPITLINMLRPFPQYRYLVLFQLFRFYRVVWAIPNVRTLLIKVGGGIWGIANMVLFVLIMILLCCAVGMQMFGGTIPLKEDDEGIFQRFDSFGWSFLALYQLFSGEDWSSILFTTMKGLANTSPNIYPYPAVIFVIMFFGISNFILLNLFVAVLVENLEINESSKRRIQLEDYFKGIKINHDRMNSYLSPFNVYRYVSSETHHLPIKGIPQNLVLPVERSNAQQFLNHYRLDTGANKTKSSLWSRIGRLNMRQIFVSQTIKPEPAEQDKFTSFSGITDQETLLSINQPEKEESLPLFQDAHTLARDEFYDAHPTYDKTLFIFSQRSRLRRISQIFAGSQDHPKFPFAPFTLRWFANRIFFTFIVLSVIANVFITLDQTPAKLKEFYATPQTYISDGVFLVIFSIDVGIHVIADGFLFTPHAYLHSIWNLFYFIALLLSYIDYFASLQGAEGLSRFARAGKAFRILRLISFSETAKFTLNAVLVSGFWKLFDAALVALCFLIPWAIYLQNVFASTFFSCNADVNTKMECIGEFKGTNKILMPRVWSNPWYYSFDNFTSSLRILFEITSGEGWTDVMKQGMMVTGKDQQPKEYSSPFNSLFFITFNFMVSVSILSLFVSIVIDNFTTRSGSALLAVEQRRWKDLSKLLRNIEPPKKRYSPPSNPVIAWFYKLATTKRSWLTRMMGVVYLAILAVLSTERVMTSERELKIKIFIEFALLLVCSVEVFVRIIGLGPRLYFSNAWNFGQFILVSVSLCLAGTMLLSGYERTLQNYLNSMLVLLALRIISMFDGLHQLLQTLKASMFSILNLLFVWIILFLIYATIFIQVFGLTRVGVNGTENMVNFRDAGNALMMLVRFSQGEGWNSVMYDFTVQPPFCVIDNPTLYLSSDCGSPAWSYVLFMSFNILSMYIFLNMFVGVIVDNFSYCYQLDNDDEDDVDESSVTSDMLSRGQTRSFKSSWINFDKNRTGYLRPDRIVPFLLSLSQPFEVRIYNSLYSIDKLMEVSFQNYTAPSTSQCTKEPKLAELKNLDLKVLNSLLRTMDIDTCNLRRRRLNIIYHECMMFIKPGKGIQFTDMLLVLARHLLIDPQIAFEIGDLLKYNQIKEQIFFRVNMEKVVGTLKMLVLRRRFLKHLRDKRDSPIEVPEAELIQINYPDQASEISGSSYENPPMLLQIPENLNRRRTRSSLASSGMDSDLDDIDPEMACAFIDKLQENEWTRLINPDRN